MWMVRMHVEPNPLLQFTNYLVFLIGRRFSRMELDFVSITDFKKILKSAPNALSLKLWTSYFKIHMKV